MAKANPDLLAQAKRGLREMYSHLSALPADNPAAPQPPALQAAVPDIQHAVPAIQPAVPEIQPAAPDNQPAFPDIQPAAPGAPQHPQAVAAH